jgi:hypothetical protein
MITFSLYDEWQKWHKAEFAQHCASIVPEFPDSGESSMSLQPLTLAMLASYRVKTLATAQASYRVNLQKRTEKSKTDCPADMKEISDRQHLFASLNEIKAR